MLKCGPLGYMIMKNFTRGKDIRLAVSEIQAREHLAQIFPPRRKILQFRFIFILFNRTLASLSVVEWSKHWTNC